MNVTYTIFVLISECHRYRGFKKDVYADKVNEFVCSLHTRYNVKLVVVYA